LFTHPFAKNSLCRFCFAGAVFFVGEIELTLSPKRKMKQLAVIFDMDGVIVDNSKYHQQAWEEFSKEYNIHFTEEKFKTVFFGRINEEVLPILFNRDLSRQEISKLADEKEKIYREIYAPHLTPVKGLRNLLHELNQANIPVGVATSAPKENVDFIINGLDIGNYINTIIDDSMVSEGKPAPDIYIETAKRLNTKPADCVVFEDSFSGTQSAWNAGAKVVAVTTTMPAKKHKFAHHIINDFTEISIHIIRKKLFNR